MKTMVSFIAGAALLAASAVAVGTPVADFHSAYGPGVYSPANQTNSQSYDGLAHTSGASTLTVVQPNCTNCTGWYGPQFDIPAIVRYAQGTVSNGGTDGVGSLNGLVGTVELECLATSLGTAKVRVIRQTSTFRVVADALDFVGQAAESSVGNPALASAKASMVLLGQTATVQVTGVAAFEIDWHCSFVRVSYHRPADPVVP